VSEKIEDWKAITPATLVAPIKHIRKMFDQGVWKCSQVTKKLCFADLHPDDRQVDLDPYQSAFAVYRTIIGPAAAQQFDKDHQVDSPPAIFHAYLQAFAAGVRTEIHRLFNEVLQIGIAHSARLKQPPADWAKAHLSIMINSNEHMVKLWIKSVCDKQDYSKPLKTDQETEDFFFWKDWRAPKLIYMRPSGNLPYDPSAAWNREDDPMTNKLLEGLSGRVIQSLSFGLDRLAGDAHVELAKAGGTVGATTIKEAGFWGSIHAEFKALAQEERAYSPNNAGDRWLVAHVSYGDPCAICGDWTVYRGINEEFKARFEALATRAGKALEPIMPSKPLHVWLHCLFLDLVEHNSEFLFAAEKGVGGIIKNICAASSTYSARLDMNALEKSDGSGVQDDDRHFAQMAIEEALKSVPEDDRPHPKVGAVVVKDGRVLSKAHRGESPKSHAEYIALEQKLSDDLVAGATVYTTLEPCTTRKHPKIPCAQRLVDRKVARVVIGMLDPNPEIRGLGEQLLGEAGIEIQLFQRDLKAQVEEMNREFIRNQKQRQTLRETLREKASQPGVSGGRELELDLDMQRQIQKIDVELAAYHDVYRPPGMGARDSRPLPPAEIQREITLLEAKKARLLARLQGRNRKKD